MALGMMQQISANIQNATFFAIVAVETADVSNKEQLVIAFGGFTTVLWYTKITSRPACPPQLLKVTHLPRKW